MRDEITNRFHNVFARFWGDGIGKCMQYMGNDNNTINQEVKMSKTNLFIRKFVRVSIYFLILQLLFLWVFNVDVGWAADSGVEFGIEDDLTIRGVEGTDSDPDFEVNGYSAFATTPATADNVTSGAGSVYMQGSLEVDGDIYPAAAGIWSATGSLGVGTTAPSFKLDVWGDIRATQNIIGRTTGGTEIFRLANSSLDAVLRATQATGDIVFQAGGATERMRIMASGNVGIGTSYPSSVLHFYGAVGATNALLSEPPHTEAIIKFNYTAADNWQGMGVDSSKHLWINNRWGGGDIVFRQSGEAAMVINSNRNVGIGTTNPVTNLEIEGLNTGTSVTSINDGVRLRIENRDMSGNNTFSAVDFGVDGESYMGRIATVFIDKGAGVQDSDIIFSNMQAGTVKKPLIIKNSGNVGIGTEVPSHKLDVFGGIKATGVTTFGGLTYTWPGSQAANYVLSTNGSGTLTWIEATSISGAVSGSGTVNYLPKWSATDIIADSMLYDDGTNVGIGTTTPGQLLHLNKASGSNPAIRITRDGSGSTAYLGDLDTNNDGILRLYDSGGTIGVQLRGNMGSNSYITSGAAGNVGIGSTGPLYKLDVVGSIKASGAIYGDLAAGGIGGSTIQDADTDTKIQTEEGADDDSIRFDTAGAERMVISSSGNVGIGVATPSAFLDVQGAAQFGTGNVNLIDSTGKITGISSAYFASVDGSALTNLNATNLASGTVADTRLSANVSLFGSAVESAEITDATIVTADIADETITRAKLAGDALEGSVLRAVPCAAGVTAGSVLYYNGSQFLKARANDESTLPAIAIALTAESGGTCNVLLQGKIYKNSWGLTPGSVYFVSPTVAGGIGTTKPTTTGEYVQRVGIARTGDVFLFNPGVAPFEPAEGGLAGPHGDVHASPGQDPINFERLSVGASYTMADAPLHSLVIQGNVGIGTTNPGFKFDLQGGDVRIAMGQKYRIGSSQVLQIADAKTRMLTGTGGGWEIMDSTQSEKLVTVLNSGNVGIGTTNPAKTLEVYGDIKVKTTGTTTFGGVTYTWPSSQAASYVLTTDGSGGLSWTSIGGNSISDDSLDWDKFADNMTLDATTSINMGTYDLKFDATTFVIDASANKVGIGTASPTQKLDIYGGIRLGASGTNNVLHTAAAGGAATGPLYWGNKKMSGAITVREVDGTPSILDVETIEFDQSTGLEVLNQGGGVARIQIGSHWKELYIDGTAYLTPSGQEPLDFITGSDIDITANSGATPQSLTFAVEDDVDFSAVRASSAAGLGLYDDGSNLGLFVEDGGQVGIGTTSPAAKLTLLQTQDSAGGFGIEGNGFGWSTYKPDILSSNSTFFEIEGKYDTHGTVHMSSGSLSSNQHVWNFNSYGKYELQNYDYFRFNAVEMQSNGDADPIHSNANLINFNNDGISKFIIKGGGNVGISQTSPTYKLDITGDMRTTTGAYFATSSGNVGVGSTAPLYKLDVAGDIYSSGTIYGDLAAGGIGGSTIQDADSDTKIETEASADEDYIRFDTAGTERMTIKSDGNVGIGTISPSARLSVHSPQSTVGFLIKGAASQSADLFQIKDSMDYGLLTMDSSGSLGIGTTAPSKLLTLAQQADADGIRIYGYDDKASDYVDMFMRDNGYFRIQTGGTRSMELNVPTGAAMFFLQNGSEVARLQSSQFKLPDNGAFGLGNPSGTADYSFGYNSADDTFRIADGGNLTGAPRMTLNNLGNFGIGTTTPAHLLEVGTTLYVDNANGRIAVGDSTPDLPLDVVGSANISGSLRLGTVGGASDTLDVDGTANISGQTVISGNLGIGASSPTGRLQVAGDEVRIGDSGTVDYASADGDLYVEDDLEVDGDVIVSGYLKGSDFRQGALIQKRGKGAWGGAGDGANWKKIAETTISGTWGYSDLYGTIFLSEDGTIFSKIKIYIHYRSVGDLSIDAPYVTYSLESMYNATSFQTYPPVRIVKTADTDEGNKTYELQVQSIDINWGLAGWDITYDSSDSSYTHTVYDSLQTSGTPLSSSHVLNQGDKHLLNKLYVGGNVGIGTTDPSQKLDVVGNIEVSGTTTFNNTAYTWPSSETADYVLKTDGSGNLTWVNASGIAGTVDGSGTGNYIPKWSDEDTVTDSVIYELSSKIGIGTTNPGAILAVGADAFKVTSAGIVSAGTWQGTAIADAYVSDTLTASDLAAGASVVEDSEVDNNITLSGGTISSNNISGTLTTTAALILGDGGDAITIDSSNWDVNSTGAASGFTSMTVDNIQTDGNTISATNNSGLALYDNASLGIFIKDGGNLGIGTTSPSQKLDVVGNFELSGTTTLGNQTYTWPGSQTASHVLSTNGSGVLSWVNADGIAGVVSGSGTGNYIPKWSDQDTVADSVIYESSGKIGIGTVSPDSRLDVAGGNISLGGGYLSNDGDNEGLKVLDSGIVQTTAEFYVGSNNMITMNPTSSFIQFGWDADTTGIIQGKSGKNVGLQLSPSGTGDIELVTDADSNLIISGAGNIGIGSTVPNNQLRLGGPGWSWTDTSNPQMVIYGADNETAVVAFKIEDEDDNEYFHISSTGDGVSDAGKAYIAGNTGIGSTTPLYKLDVAGSIKASGTIYGDLALGTVTPTGFTEGSVAFAGSGGTLAQDNANLFWDDSTNRLGLGTTTPTVSLEVIGAGKFSTNLTVSTGNINLADSSGNVSIGNTSGALALSSSGLNLTTAGAVSGVTSLSMDNQLTNSYASSAAINLTGNSSGITFAGTGTNQIITGGTNHLALMPGGNVGIGTTAPGAKLDITQVFRVTGASAPSYPSSGKGLEITYDTNSTEMGGTGQSVIWSSDRDGSVGLDLSLRAREIGFFTGSSPSHRVRIDNNGNVGIGNAGPGSKLSVQGGVSIGDSVYATAAAPSGGMIIKGNVGIGTTVPGAKLSFVTGTTAADGINFGGDTNLYRYSANLLRSDDDFAIGGVNYNVVLRSASQKIEFGNRSSSWDTNLYRNAANTLRTNDSLIIDGNLGIGTTAPNQLLHIEKATTPQLKIRWTDTSSYGAHIFTEGATYMGGFAVIGSAFSDSSRQNAVEFISAKNNLGTLGFRTKTGGAYYNRMRILNNGNVGIGNTGPGSKLSVQGGVSIGNSIYATTAAPSEGMIIKGNVGIGATVPTQKLHVAGNVYTSGDVDVDGVLYTDNVQFDGNVNVNDYELQKVRVLQGKDYDDDTGGTDNKYQLLFRDGAHQFYSGGVVVGNYSNGTWSDLADGMLIVEGNIGVGATAPEAQLEVEDTTSSGAVELAKFEGNDGYIRLWNDNTYSRALLGLIENTAITRPVFYTSVSGESYSRFGFSGEGELKWGAGSTDHDVNLYRDSADKLRTADTVIVDGNLGVGTPNPSEKLEVTASGMKGFEVRPQANYISLLVDGVEVARMEP